MAILTQLEYRFNFIIDAFVQPVISSVVEIVLWISIFKASGKSEIGGFPLDSYLSYAIFALFFARITSSWMYNFKMIEEIESGSINGLLVRPMSFFEYYLSQLLGYKLFSSLLSLLIPFAVVSGLGLPLLPERFPITFLLVMYYIVFIHLVGFIISTFAFHFTRVHSFVGAFNLSMWLFSGELFPLDLLPPSVRGIFIALPFSAAVYIPNAYLSGRIGSDLLVQSFFSITVGIAVLSLLATVLWKKGVRSYVGTGA